MKIIKGIIPTPIGDMVAGIFNDKVCLLEFHDRRMLPTQFDRIQAAYQAEIKSGDHYLLDEIALQLKEYFAETRQAFDFPIDCPGSSFQKRVWESLMQIPYGQTRSYAQQSELLGDKKAIRAMAKANGDNRLAIVIPCHRVIGSNGDLVGYGGKLWRKKYLLELEGALVRQGQLFD